MRYSAYDAHRLERPDRIGYGLWDLIRPVYQSGRAYLGTWETTPVVGGLAAFGFGAADMLSVSIGDESHYRGIVYEEMKRAVGAAPARMADMIIFPLIHLPSDLGSGPICVMAQWFFSSWVDNML
jgi:hypothetical protein